MDSTKLRKLFLDFFRKYEHTIVSSSSLLPTDQSVLFTTAGMQQFKPYYLGEKSPYGNNVASCQKCIRTSDIEEVGDERHLTFFEMLGNFSFGGYFKEEAIKLAYNFIVKELKLKIDYVTVFSPDKVIEGDWRKGVQEDKESFEIWKKVGVPEKKIKKEGIDSFWGPTGDEGPCGPTTEIYINGIEVWNIVFNEFFCDKDKSLKKLEPAGVDTGMGLERLAMVVQKKETIFETDLFESLIKEIEKLSEKKYKDYQKEFRIIADHIKASVFLASEGVAPSNLAQGYVVRRLMRRVVRYGKLLKMSDDFITPLIKIVVEIYKDVYPELAKKHDEIISIMRQEEEKFEKTLEKGLKILSQELRVRDYNPNKETKDIPDITPIDGILAYTPPVLTGKWLFDIYQTFGFPLELSLEEIEKMRGKMHRLELERVKKEFYKEMEKHQELSRTASAGMFKGGLADASLETTKLHTAAHLMLAGLRKVLGKHIFQKGSNITAERLRFDFSHKEKMTPEQIKMVEDFVNEAIKKDLPVKFEEMTLDEAKKINAMGVFESKYGEKVKVYTIGPGDEIVSREICGGPHVERTGILGNFKITKEESSSSGIRRIKAILEQ
ncbi:alanine--tRNA ligase [Patescibacteria group bacterium]|nr:alanine--tRNA ligase [Patescibacteria group bacterium]